jgi:hypothetical protein
VYRLITLSAGVLILGVLALGCGNSGEETTTAEITRAQFIRQARSVCTQIDKEMEKAAAAWEKAHSKELDFDTAIRQIMGPALEEQATRLRTLTAPEEEAEKVNRMLKHLEKAAAAYAMEGTAIKSTVSIETFEHEAKTYNLRACWA